MDDRAALLQGIERRELALVGEVVAAIVELHVVTVPRHIARVVLLMLVAAVASVLIEPLLKPCRLRLPVR